MRASKKTYTKRRKGKGTKKRNYTKKVKSKTRRKRVRGGMDPFTPPKKENPTIHDQYAPEKTGRKPTVPNRSLFGVRKQLGKNGDEKRTTYDGNPGIKDDKPPDAAYTDGYDDSIAGRLSRFHYSDMTQPGEEIKNREYIDNYKKDTRMENYKVNMMQTMKKKKNKKPFL
jgi:hypothetical protein